MIVKSLTLTTTKSSLYDLLVDQDRHVNSIGLQAATDNTGVINWGDVDNQGAFLAAGQSALLPVKNTKDIYLVAATADDVVQVILF